MTSVGPITIHVSISDSSVEDLNDTMEVMIDNMRLLPKGEARTILSVIVGHLSSTIDKIGNEL